MSDRDPINPVSRWWLLAFLVGVAILCLAATVVWRCLVPDVVISGFDELDEGLRALPTRTMSVVIPAMHRANMAVEGILKEYPQETAANKPGRVDEDGNAMGYYERNRGSWYPVKNMPAGVVKFGKTRGILKTSKMLKEQTGAVAFKLSPTSEQLGKSWSSEVMVGKDEVIGVIATDVSYAQAVQGTDQDPLFAQIGWTKADDALDQATPDIQAAFDEAVDSLHL